MPEAEPGTNPCTTFAGFQICTVWYKILYYSSESKGLDDGSIICSEEPKLSMARPRAFEVDEALDRAMHVFWRKGYEGTSLSDLTEAMGINRPSLYATFGDKKTLFLQALDRYQRGPSSYARKSLEEPTARRVVERQFEGVLDLLTNPHTPPGCFLVQGALACGEDASDIRMELAARRSAGEAAIRERMERALAEGDLPPDADPAALARFVRTAVYGLAVQSAGGATRAELEEVIQVLLAAWPSEH